MNFKPYRYTPKKEIKNAAVFSGVCFFAAAALLLISVFVRGKAEFRVIYELSAVIFATVGVQVTTRFILSDYVYILDKTDFIIYKINGRKSTQICNIPLDTASGVTIKSPEKSKKSFRKAMAVRKNFCQNMFPAKPCEYIFEYGGKTSAVTFDADENFIKEMQIRIDYAKTHSDSDSDFGDYNSYSSKL